MNSYLAFLEEKNMVAGQAYTNTGKTLVIKLFFPKS